MKENLIGKAYEELTNEEMETLQGGAGKKADGFVTVTNFTITFCPVTTTVTVTI